MDRNDYYGGDSASLNLTQVLPSSRHHIRLASQILNISSLIAAVPQIPS